MFIYVFFKMTLENLVYDYIATKIVFGSEVAKKAQNNGLRNSSQCFSNLHTLKINPAVNYHAEVEHVSELENSVGNMPLYVLSSGMGIENAIASIICAASVRSLCLGNTTSSLCVTHIVVLPYYCDDFVIENMKKSIVLGLTHYGHERASAVINRHCYIPDFLVEGAFSTLRTDSRARLYSSLMPVKLKLSRKEKKEYTNKYYEVKPQNSYNECLNQNENEDSKVFYRCKVVVASARTLVADLLHQRLNIAEYGENIPQIIFTLREIDVFHLKGGDLPSPLKLSTNTNTVSFAVELITEAQRTLRKNKKETTEILCSSSFNGLFWHEALNTFFNKNKLHNPYMLYLTDCPRAVSFMLCPSRLLSPKTDMIITQLHLNYLSLMPRYHKQISEFYERMKNGSMQYYLIKTPVYAELTSLLRLNLILIIEELVNELRNDEKRQQCTQIKTEDDRILQRYLSNGSGKSKGLLLHYDRICNRLNENLNEKYFRKSSNSQSTDISEDFIHSLSVEDILQSRRGPLLHILRKIVCESDMSSSFFQFNTSKFPKVTLNTKKILKSIVDVRRLLGYINFQEDDLCASFFLIKLEKLLQSYVNNEISKTIERQSPPLWTLSKRFPLVISLAQRRVFTTDQGIDKNEVSSSERRKNAATFTTLSRVVSIDSEDSNENRNQTQQIQASSCANSLMIQPVLTEISPRYRALAEHIEQYLRRTAKRLTNNKNVNTSHELESHSIPSILIAVRDIASASRICSLLKRFSKLSTAEKPLTEQERSYFISYLAFRGRFDIQKGNKNELFWGSENTKAIHKCNISSSGSFAALSSSSESDSMSNCTPVRYEEFCFFNTELDNQLNKTGGKVVTLLQNKEKDNQELLKQGEDMLSNGSGIGSNSTNSLNLKSSESDVDNSFIELDERSAKVVSEKLIDDKTMSNLCNFAVEDKKSVVSISSEEEESELEFLSNDDETLKDLVMTVEFTNDEYYQVLKASIMKSTYELLPLVSIYVAVQQNLTVPYITQWILENPFEPEIIIFDQSAFFIRSVEMVNNQLSALNYNSGFISVTIFGVEDNFFSDNPDDLVKKKQSETQNTFESLMTAHKISLAALKHKEGSEILGTNVLDEVNNLERNAFVSLAKLKNSMIDSRSTWWHDIGRESRLAALHEILGKYSNVEAPDLRIKESIKRRVYDAATTEFKGKEEYKQEEAQLKGHSSSENMIDGDFIADKSKNTVSIIIDDREFRAILPYYIYLSGLRRIYVDRLSIGDYILSRFCAMERKSFFDLIQSTIYFSKKNNNSSFPRLTMQLSKACAHYIYPIIVIENSNAADYSHYAYGYSSTDSHVYRLTAGLPTLTAFRLYKTVVKLFCKYPHAVWFWTRSPIHTSDIIFRLKMGIAAQTHNPSHKHRDSLTSIKRKNCDDFDLYKNNSIEISSVEKTIHNLFPSGNCFISCQIAQKDIDINDPFYAKQGRKNSSGQNTCIDSHLVDFEPIYSQYNTQVAKHRKSTELNSKSIYTARLILSHLPGVGNSNFRNLCRNLPSLSSLSFMNLQEIQTAMESENMQGSEKVNAHALHSFLHYKI